MSAGAAASAAAIAAIAAAKKRREEESLSRYSAEELVDGREFKILRSASGGFRRTTFLNETLEQEGRTGWELVEKFDNYRIRLKRPQSARENDRNIELDAYRSHVGMSEALLVFWILAVLLGLGFVGVVLSKG